MPLRMALTEHPSDEESNSLLYPGAPWSVRLAVKLLRLRAAGIDSPWHPYIQVRAGQGKGGRCWLSKSTAAWLPSNNGLCSIPPLLQPMHGSRSSAGLPNEWHN